MPAGLSPSPAYVYFLSLKYRDMAREPEPQTSTTQESHSGPCSESKLEPVQEDSSDSSTDQPQLSLPDGGLRAWMAVAGAFGMMACSVGYMGTFGVYQSYYHEKILPNNSHSQIAWIGSLQSCLMTTTGLLSGPLMDRFGTKFILVPASTLFVTSLMLTSVCREYYQFVLAHGLLGGFCLGMIYTPAISIMGHYFDKRRDLAIGIASSGSSLGGILFPIMLLRLLEHTNLGFGWSVRVLGFFMITFLSIGCVTLVPRIPPRCGPHFLPEAFKSPVYSLQLVGYCLIFWGIYTPFFYIPSFAIANGISVDWSFYIMPLHQVGAMIGRILGGRLTKYFGRFNTMIGAVVASSILIFSWIKATSLGGLIAFAMLFGFSSGAIIGLFPTTIAVTAPHPNHIGTYLGMLMGSLGIFVLTGSPMMGAIIARYGSFTPAIAASGAFTMGGACMLIAARLFHSRKLIA